MPEEPLPAVMLHFVSVTVAVDESMETPTLDWPSPAVAEEAVMESSCSSMAAVRPLPETARVEPLTMAVRLPVLRLQFADASYAPKSDTPLASVSVSAYSPFEM